MIEAGTREIVFTGIHIGDYGEDSHNSEVSHPTGLDSIRPITTDAQVVPPFVTLLNSIIKIPDLKRIRISSLEPMEASEDLLRCLSGRKDEGISSSQHTAGATGATVGCPKDGRGGSRFLAHLIQFEFCIINDCPDLHRFGRSDVQCQTAILGSCRIDVTTG